MITGRGAKIRVIRWSARMLGVSFAGFFLFMAIGSFLETRTHTGSIKPLAAIWLSLMAIYALAMFLALIRERAALLVGVAALLGAHVEGLFLGLFEYPGRLTLVSVVNPLLLAQRRRQLLQTARLAPLQSA